MKNVDQISMVLGRLPPRKIAPRSGSAFGLGLALELGLGGGNFPWGQFSWNRYLSQINYAIFFVTSPRFLYLSKELAQFVMTAGYI